jgi:mRNA-degrading endonuclease RelE of RelBE toxin-antitoxin system
VPARFVEFSPSAEAARTALSIPARRAINAAIRQIANAPEWQPERYLAGADSPHGGRIAKIAHAGGVTYAIVYRLREGGRVVWILDISAIVIG